ncbi:MAG: hypothetical protein V7700_17520 [Halioglobus sp.]
MTALAPHIAPSTKQDHLDAWRTRGRISVPTRKGRILDLLVERIYETTAVDGLPLDLLVEARATHQAELKRFGVVFAEVKPLDNYPLPVLWINDAVGSWII